MAIIINKNTRVIVQGITGLQGSFHAKLMAEYGTKIVAGVTPGKGGQVIEIAGGSADMYAGAWAEERAGAGGKIPVFDSVAEALKFSPADFSVIFVPAPHALSAAMEAMRNNLNPVIITEHIPVYDAMLIMQEAAKRKLIVIGPNCPGITSPDECKIGIMPGNIFKKGNIGVLSRSGTLTYEIVKQLSDAGFGQSTVVGIGGDMVTGYGFNEGLSDFENDPDTSAIVLIGEIGGESEEHAASHIRGKIGKPVVAYVAGRVAPAGRTMGHAGAIINGTSGTYDSKFSALKNAGVKMADFPWDVPRIIAACLKQGV
jgi:succinyl-CoA synthetase alpha subunit